MSTEKMQASFRLLMLITTPKLAEKALLLFEKGRLPMQIQAYAHGTASREMMDMLGLDSGEKSLLLTVMPKADADDLLVHLRRELRLGLSGSGIAFTVPMSGANKRVLQMVQQLPGDPGVLGGDKIRLRQGFGGPGRDIAQIPDGRGTKI